MSDLVINVKQITQYPARAPVQPNDAILLQTGGLGGPYAYATAQQLVATALNPGGPLSVGETPPANANPASIWTNNLQIPPNGGLNWNAYVNTAGPPSWAYWQANTAASLAWDPNAGFLFSFAAAGSALAPIPSWDLPPVTTALPPRVAVLSNAGHLTVHDQVTVARNATSALELTTLQQVQTAIAAAVTSWNGRTGAVTLTLADITGAGGAPLNNANLTGSPSAPTPAPGSNNTQLATTNFVAAAVANAVTSFNTRTGAVTLTLADVVGVGGAPLASPLFSGNPRAPTPSAGDSTTNIATTAFVASSFAPLASPVLTGDPRAPTPALGDADTSIATTAFVAANTVNSFNTRQGAIVLTLADITAAGGAPIDSPNFTSVPTAPTAGAGTATGQLATTAFVMNAVTAATTGVVSWNTRTGAVTMTLADITSIGGAPINNTALTGIPTAPTAPGGTNSTQLATTAYVAQAIAAATVGVASFNGRTGNVTLLEDDVTTLGFALLASPHFTGVPQAPTPATSDNSQTIATTAFVHAVAGSAVTSFNGRTGAISLIGNDVSAAGGALLTSPIFTGLPQAPTAAPGTNTGQLATTAFVAAALGGTAVVNTFNGRTGAVTLSATDLTAVNGALIQVAAVAPGTPTDNQLWWNSNATQLYIRYNDGNSTQWVLANNTQGPPASVITPQPDGVGAAGVAAPYAREDHVHPIAPALYAGNVGRNVLHNSMFNVQQRGAGNFTTALAFTADRWQMNFVGSGASQSVAIQAAGDPGRVAIGDEAYQFAYAVAFTGTAGVNDFNSVSQAIEGARRLSGKTVIVSFWANATVAGVRMAVSFNQNFGSGGSPSTAVSVTGQTFTLTTNWVRYSAAIALPSTNGKTFGTAGNDNTQLICWFSAGTGIVSAGTVGVQTGTVQLWGVQVEIAQAGQTQPTPLEKLDLVLQFQQCQRYFQTTTILNGGTVPVAGSVTYPTAFFTTAMRTTPTVVVTSNGSSNVTSAPVSNLGITGIYATATVTNANASFSTNVACNCSADL